MSGKSFAVIGLGQFGMTLAKELANADYDVLAIDDKDENIQEIADTVTYAQTTRNRIQTVYTCDKGQIVFLDTPGIHICLNSFN